jgi:hypothetical protein
MRLPATILLLTVVPAGCVEQRLDLQSDPPGALVYLNGEEVGRTPMTTPFTFYGNFDVVLRKEGYETLKTTSKVKPPLYQLPPIDLIAALLPIPLTDEHRLSYSMQPASTQPADPQVMLERARAMEAKLDATSPKKK